MFSIECIDKTGVQFRAQMKRFVATLFNVLQPPNTATPVMVTRTYKIDLLKRAQVASENVAVVVEERVTHKPAVTLKRNVQSLSL